MKSHGFNLVTWIGEPIVRIGNKTFYSKFRYGKLKGEIGSFFKVSNSDHNGKPCHVVQIVQLYEMHNAKEDEHRAIVKWFVDCNSLPKNVNYKSLKHKLNLTAEVILDDTRAPDADISIRKLQSHCHVIFGRTFEGPSDLQQKHHPVYFCRYKVTEHCGRHQMEPYFSDDEDAAMSDDKLLLQPVVKLERVAKSLPGSPRIPRNDPGTRLCGKKSRNGKCILVKKAAVPNGEVVSITDSESENEGKNTEAAVRRLPNTKLTEEEIVSLLTADDDIGSDDNIFSEFEDEALDETSDKAQSSRKLNGVNRVQRNLILCSSSFKDDRKNNSMGKQRRPRDTSSSDDDYGESCHVKRAKLDLVETPTSSPRRLRKPHLPQKDESTLPVSEAQMRRISPTKNRPNGLKVDKASEANTLFRTPKKNSGLLLEAAYSPVSEAQAMGTPPTKNELSDTPSEPKASCRSKKKMVSVLQSDSADSPIIRTPEAHNETPRKAGRVKLLPNSPHRNFEKTFITQNSADDMPRRLSSRTPVSNKRYDDSWLVDIKINSQRKVAEEKEENQIQLKLVPRSQQASPNISSPRTPKFRKKIVEEEEDRWVHIKSSTKVQQASCNSSSPRTPKSKKGTSVRRALLTPSMPSRGHSLESPSSLLEVVRSRLCVSAVPKSLPCREKEFNNIYHFLEGKIIDKASGCMYVSGVPGTGKTATVQEVLRRLKNKADLNEIPQFDLVELNGMRMTEPRQAYVQLYRALTTQTVVADQAQQLLEKRFSTSKKKQNTTVVIVDELDMLCTRRQDVVYNLLDWPTKTSSQLVVVTIANTMDLPEKLLKGRVTSRLGLTRVTFQPYTFQQLKTIVMERLKGLNVFDHDAIELVSRKVAAVSGDARRALDICRRATELAEGKADLVGMQHVDEAVQEMSTSATVRMIKNCSTLEQNFLKAILAKMQASGLDEASFRTVYDQMFAICTFDGIKVPSVTEALQICAALGSARLLIVKHSRHDIHQDILLNVSRDDLHYALQVAAS